MSLPAPPGFTGIRLESGNVILGGSTGLAGADFYVLVATNVTTPASNWVRSTTNQFDTNGNFVWTNTLNPGAPQEFYRLICPFTGD